MSVGSGELVLYIDNTFALYKQKQAIQKMLATRKRRGPYERAQGVVAFQRLANAGAKGYVREMKVAEPWHKAFPAADREQAAKEFEAEFRSEYQLGALEYLLPERLQRKPKAPKSPGKKKATKKKKTAKKKSTKKKTTNPRRRLAGFKRCPIGTEVQTLIFAKELYTSVQAKTWSKRNGFRAGKVDETKESFRIRQRPTKHFRPGSFRTISLGSVQAVIGCPKR